MSAERTQQIEPEDGLDHPELPGVELDTIQADWGDGPSSILYDPGGNSHDEWISVDPGYVYEIGVDWRDEE